MTTPVGDGGGSGRTGSGLGGDMTRLHIWQIQAVRDLLVVAIVVAVIWIGYAMRFVTVPLLLAFALAYLVEPLVQWLCRALKMSRRSAVFLIMGTVGVATVAAVLVVVPTVVGQTSQLLSRLRSGQFDRGLDRSQEVLPPEWQTEIRKVREWIGQHQGAEATAPRSDEGDDAAGKRAIEGGSQEGRAVPPKEGPQAEPQGEGSILASLLGRDTQVAISKLVSISALLFAALLIPFYFWFFSIGFPGALSFIEQLIPQSRREAVVRMAKEMDAAVAGFVRGRILIAAGMGVMFAIGWSIGRVPYALSLGVLAGFLSVVPYLGIVATIPAIVLLAMSQLALPEAHRMAWYWIVGGPPLVFVIVQSIEGYILTPVFAGRATNLGPVSIFVAVLAGASVAGVYGMLLAIPVAACGKILIRETVMPSIRNWAQGKVSDPLPLDRD